MSNFSGKQSDHRSRGFVQSRGASRFGQCDFRRCCVLGPRNLEIITDFASQKSFTSRCRGTAEDLRAFRLTYIV